MAGRDLSSLAFAFARFPQKEDSRFTRTQRHRIARRRQGLGARNGPRRRSFTRNHRQNRSGPHRRFFAGNHRQNRRRGYARRGNQPLHGRAPTVHQAGSSTPATAPLQQAGPSAPATSPSVFNIPPMDWLLAGPPASFLEEDVMFPCELAPPPLPPYCMQHGFGPCPARTDSHVPDLPSPTPVAAAHTGPVPDLPSPTPNREERGGYPTIPILNVQIKVEEEGMEAMGSSSSLRPPSPATPPPPPAPPLPPTPPPEARRILRQFAAAMAQNRAALRGAWSPDALGFAGAPEASSNGSSRAALRGQPRFP
uniref:Uncharacterized protein n=1 Tax=Hordeum vulgare subsp. vulgare TaxID=112509 RepID=A0A8I6Y4C6_HORVV